MKKLVLVLLSLVIVLGVFTVGIMAQEQSADLQIGFGRVDITPDLNDEAYSAGIHLQGGSWANRVATEVGEPIYATCIALTENGETILLYSLDMKVITSNFSTAAKAAISRATGVPVDNIQLCATHTHSSVAIRYSWDGVEHYKTSFYEKVVEAALAAMSDRSAVSEVHTGNVQTERLAFVRHYLMNDGSVAGSNFGNHSSGYASHIRDAQKDLQLVKITRAGKQDLVLMSFSTHATFNESGTVLSADYPAYARQYVEDNTDSLATFFAGSVGDQVPTSRISGLSYTKDCRVYGEKLGQYAVEGLAGLTKLDDISLKFNKHTFVCDTNKKGVTAERVALAEQVKTYAETHTTAQTNTYAISLGFASRLEATWVLTRNNLPSTRDMELRVMSIGELGFALAPYEMFGVNGAYIRENSPYENTVIISCSGNQQSYLASEEAFAYNSYESFVCYFAEGTAEEMAQGFVDMLEQLQMPEGYQCPHCNQLLLAEDWTPWGFTSGNVAEGHYYLPDNFTAQTAQITIPAGVDVCLDLRGNVYQTEGIRSFSVSGTLSVVDSVGTGLFLTTGKNEQSGGFATVSSTGELNLYGGTIQFVEKEGIVIPSGGLVFVNKGKLNIHGGTLRGGVVRPDADSNAQGGNIYLTGAGAIMTMDGGAVTGGMARRNEASSMTSYQGGNIYALSSAVINISGGTVSNGYCDQDGGNFYIASATLNISGNAVISGGHAYRNGGNICQSSRSSNSVTVSGGTITGGVAGGKTTEYANNTFAQGSGGGGNLYVEDNGLLGTLTISGGTIAGDVKVAKIGTMTLSGTPQIGLGNSNGLMLASGVTADVSGLTDGTEIYVWANGVFTDTLTDAETTLGYFKGAVRTGLSVSGNALKGTQGTSGYCPHCKELITNWTSGWGTINSITTDNTHRYLTAYAASQRAVNASVILDLNGITVSVEKEKLVEVATTKSLTVLDSWGGGKLAATGSLSGGSVAGGVVYVGNGATFELLSGTVCRLDPYTTTNAGKETSCAVGGVIYGFRSAKINIKGGVVRDGVVDKKYGTTHAGPVGGNIALGNTYGTLDMSGGIVINGKAEDTAAGELGQGGNIYAHNQGNVKISGGFVLDGTASLGGNVRVGDSVSGNSGTLTVSGGTVAYGTGTNGGNINTLKGATISGGYITSGTATSGGNLYFEANDSTHSITGSTIIAGTATNGGNIYQAMNGTLNITNGAVLCGTGTNGGNIHLANCTMNVNSGSLVFGGTAQHGGNLFFTSANVVVDGGVVSGGTATGRGGNIYMAATGPSLLLKNGGKITDGAAVNGGNIATNSATATINLEYGTVSGGTATEGIGGNIRLMAAATVNIAGATVTGETYGLTGTVNLSGNARVVKEDGSYTDNMQFTTGKLQVSNDWIGEASVKWTAAYTYGDTVASTNGQCGTLGDAFTAGGSYSGKLVYEGLDTRPEILGVAGNLIVETDGI